MADPAPSTMEDAPPFILPLSVADATIHSFHHNFTYVDSLSLQVTQLQCGRCYLPAWEPIMHACGQLSCYDCIHTCVHRCNKCQGEIVHPEQMAMRPDTTQRALLDALRVQCNACNTQLRRDEFVPHWNAMHMPVAASSVATRMPFSLYANAVQSCLAFLPRHAVFSACVVSRAWNLAGRQELGARRVNQKKRDAQIKTDMTQLDQLAAMLCAKDGSEQQTLDIVLRFKQILGRAELGFTDAVVRQNGVIGRLVQLMQHAHPTIQVAAIACIDHIVAANSDTYVLIVLEQGAVPVLVQLLDDSVDNRITASVMSALGNIICDGHEGRDAFLSTGALPRMLHRFTPIQKTTVETMRIFSWVLSFVPRTAETPPRGTNSQKNLPHHCSLVCNVIFVARRSLLHFRPLPPTDIVLSILPAMHGLLHVNDDQVIEDGVRGFVNLSNGLTSDNADDLDDWITESGVLARLFQLISHPALNVFHPALKACWHLLAHGDMETKCKSMVEAGGISPLSAKLQHADPTTRFHTMALLRHMSATEGKHVQDIFACPGLVPSILASIGSMAVELRTRHACVHIICNLAERSTTDLKRLVDAGALSALGTMLDGAHHRIVANATRCMLNLFRADIRLAQEQHGLCVDIGTCESVRELQERNGGILWARIEQLCSHPDQEVAGYANEFVDELAEADGNMDDN
jgi:hypothetical protein